MSTISGMYARELARLESEGKLETVGRLKIHRYHFNGASRCSFGLQIWRGNAKKPLAAWTFQSEESREKYIVEKIEADRASVACQANRKREAAERAVAMAEQMPVGAILHYSWGWEQTNCDFFQVVERKGMTVWIREIGCRIVDGSGYSHGMADKRMPARDSFIGDEVLRKRINECGVTMDHGIASPCGDDEAFYCSWYA